MMARTFMISVLVFSLSSFPLCKNKNEAGRHKKQQYVHGIYRVPLGDRDGEKIWIVDGLLIRNEIYPEFLYGGNEEPYLFVPHHEIWIDHAISGEEFEYTLVHELNERNLMARYGMTYADAHDSSLALEHRMRSEDVLKAREHERSLSRVSPTDCDGLKQLSELPDSIVLTGIYRRYVRTENGIAIWIVDGLNVRRAIFPDFGFSGNDLAYRFIPSHEIWIDGDISCEETEFSIASELAERNSMAHAEDYDRAYLQALHVASALRKNAHRLAASHRAVMIPETLDRQKGTGKEKEMH
jgi:hypothetical protein